MKTTDSVTPANKELMDLVPNNPSEQLTRSSLEKSMDHTLSQIERREEFRNRLRIFSLTTASAAGAFIVQRENANSQIGLLILVILFLEFMNVMDTFLYDLCDRQNSYNRRLLKHLIPLTPSSKKGDKRAALQEIYAGVDPSDFWRKKRLHYNKGRLDKLWYWLPLAISTFYLLCMLCLTLS